MSDSGRQMGQCEHGVQSDYCMECLRTKYDRLLVEATNFRNFTEAMDGDWKVVEHRINGGELRVVYRSEKIPAMTWSHLPLRGSAVAATGTIGRIGFIESH